MTTTRTMTVAHWCPIVVGYALAVIVAVVAGLQLQVLNVVSAAAVALVIGGGWLGLAALADLRRSDPRTRSAPLPVPSNRSISSQPAPGTSPDPWHAGSIDDDPFDRPAPPAATRGTAHGFAWHSLVADVWKPGSQCAQCAEPLAPTTDPCPRCGERTTSASSAVLVTTSGPFLDAIQRLPSSGGSDV